MQAKQSGSRGNSESITGILSGIRFYRDGFLIGKLDNGVTVKGHMRGAQIGLDCKLEGRWIRHPTYGRQFEFKSYETSYPRDDKAICAYLKENAKWVGPAISELLVETYGSEVLEICKKDPKRVAREIPGLTLKRAEMVSKMLLEREQGEALELSLKKILLGTRISHRAVAKIVEIWGKDAPQKIRENPFALIDSIGGIGFLTADQVARKVGFAKDNYSRIRAGIVYTLKEAASGSGHTCLPRKNLTILARKLLSVESKKINDVMSKLLERKELVLLREHIYLIHLFEAEQTIARKLQELMAAEVQATQPSYEGLAEDQISALRRSIASPVFILTGAPGVGKSFSCKAILRSFPNAKVHLVAPTGKAAKRMYEHTRHMAKTIHRLLEPVPKEKGWKFTRDDSNPVDGDLIIVDEMSMVDVRLFASLLKALKPGTRLVLVGDTYQLPSVGPGNVLKDLIASKRLPCQELTIIKRQNPGLIIENCHAIKDGHDITISNGKSSDFFFLERETPEEIRNTIVDLVEKRLPSSYKAHPLRDIQVISPHKTRTILSCAELNPILQKTLNPNPPVKGWRWRVGDKVINRKNEYKLEIINGDIGYVHAINGSEVVVDFENPERRVVLDRKYEHLHLAYVITCHSYQGSEAPIIVIPMHRSFAPILMQRNWVYTAVSRAQKVCILVGQREEIRKAVQRNRQQKRFTGLEEFLRGDKS